MVYRAVWPQAAPPVVDAMTISQVAAILGLDEADDVETVAWTPESAAALKAEEAEMRARSKRA